MIPARLPIGLALATLLALVACDGGGGGEVRPDADVPVEADAPGDAGPEDVAGPDAEVDAPACAPECPLAACGADDGCGGTCAPCPSDVSCEDCPLVLRVVSRDDPVLELALGFAPREGHPLPELADLRLAVDGDATMVGLEVGAPVLEAGKAPLPDPQTGEPWQVLADGTVRVSLASTEQSDPIGGGRWLVYTFRLGGAFDPLEEPVVLHLTTDEPVFAPPGAAAALWGAPIDDPVVLWPLEE